MRPITRILLVVILVISAAAWWNRDSLSVPPPKPVLRHPFRASSYQRDMTPGDETASDTSILNVPLSAIQRCGPTLHDAIDQLRKSSGRDIFVNWRALEEAGFTRKTAVDRDVNGKRLGQAIEQLLIAIDPSQSKLGYTLDEGIITISTVKNLAQNVVTRVYDVRDLVTDRPQLPARNISGFGNLPWFRSIGRESTTNLTSGVMDHVDPTSWKDRSGTVGSMRELSGQLIVTQTPENQRLLIHDLEYRRWKRDQLMTAIDASKFVVPVLVISLGIELLLWRRRKILRNRLASKMCVKCGYDLRATPDRCPECGTPVPEVMDQRAGVGVMNVAGSRTPTTG
jgi:hypothetical protein